MNQSKQQHFPYQMEQHTGSCKTTLIANDRVIEAVILAGGRGTRLSSIIGEIPKVLAPVAERPFLSYVINYLRQQGVRRFVFSLGYGAEAVESFLKTSYPQLDYTTVTEEEPIDTGGGIRLALQKAKSNQVLVVNGDTLFKVDLALLYKQHMESGAECTLALKHVKSTGRFGTVNVGNDNNILSFAEKTQDADGFINGGIYLLDKMRFFNRSFPLNFSFETDYLEKYTGENAFTASVHNGYFIDIGVPQDYEKAQRELEIPPLDLSDIDKSWTLFIDRDGVINNETIGEYILQPEQFVFSQGVLDSFKKLADTFGRLLIATNQKGVGKGLMTEATLIDIHSRMQDEIQTAGGRLDGIYFCTDIENTSFFRKPNPGMALMAKADFPEIDFSKSIMVGNKPSDMQFGRAAGMYTVFLATTNPEEPFPHPDIDLRFSSLAEFTASLPN